jgi:hypothetical protein
MTKRTWILLMALLISAAPLVWMTASPNSGEQLLRLTMALSGSSHHSR